MGRAIKNTKKQLSRRSRQLGSKVRQLNSRWSRLTLVGLFVWSLAIPVLGMVHDVHAYQLSPAALQVIGRANDNLSAKFSYDAANAQWQFNKSGTAAQASAIAGQQGSGDRGAAGAASALSQLQAQVGGGGKHDNSLYSVNLPIDASRGVTYFDNSTQLSFTMTPQFRLQNGKLHQGRLVYPFADGGQLVYTAKANGLKEDIVLSHNIGDWLTYRYKLDLPDTLEARLTGDGSVGIYSADPALFGNMSFGSDADEAKIMDARRTAPKNHLVFAIPTPVIKDDHGQAGQAAYELRNNVLTVTATDLDQLHYPLSVDPSVVVTSSSDFSSGNDEDNIDFGTAGQISTGGLTGGTIGSWQTAASSFNTGRHAHASVAYDGYLYILGGYDDNNGTYLQDVQYAPVSGGTVGTWQTASNNLPSVRDSLSAVAYNGYLYAIGGEDSSGNSMGNLEYAPLGSNGDVGAWQSATNNFTTAREEFGAVAYAGYLYVFGGSNNGSDLDDVQYAPLNADGSVGSWQTSPHTLPVTLDSFASTVYNGYIYIISGLASGSTYQSSAYFARIGSGGSVGSWQTAVSLPKALADSTVVTYGGYIYVIGGVYKPASMGLPSSSVYYAQINADGSLDSWRSTTSLASATFSLTGLAQGGYLYTVGGSSSSSDLNTVGYAQISPTGTLTDYQQTSSLPSAYAHSGAASGASVAYNGCVYFMGGVSGGSQVADVYYASINSDGSLGAWTHSANSMVTAVSAFAFASYNGYVYVIGGNQGGGVYSQSVQMAQLNSGSCGTSAWTTTTNYRDTLGNEPAVAYNGYLYTMGSKAGSTTSTYSIPINADGTLGTTWTQQTSFNNQRSKGNFVAYGGYLYLVGGQVSSLAITSVEYAKFTGSGTLGAWSTTSSLNTGRSYPGAVAYNGYLYAIGGDDDTSTAYATTESAKINADGSLGSWSYNTAMSHTLRNNPNISSDGNHLYFVSGNVDGYNSYSLNTYMMTINNGGTGRPGSWSTDASAVGSYQEGNTAIAYSDNLYYVCGYASSSIYVTSLAIADDGSLGSPVTTGSNCNTWGQAVAYGGYLYALGGGSSGSASAGVAYAPLSSNGSIGTWQTATSMPDGRRMFAAVAYNGYLYVLGGETNTGGISNDVEYAQIHTDGSLGSWTTAGGFTAGREGLSAVAYGSYIYVLGGSDGTTYRNDVQFANLNSDGSIGTWSAATSFLRGRYGQNSVAYDGYMYVFAGTNTSTDYNDVQYAPINGNGSLGPWQTANSFTTGRTFGGGVAYDGYLYVVAGSNYSGSSQYNDVQYALLNTISMNAHYSKLINLNTNANVGAVYFNGTPGVSLQYRTAAADGVFGSPSTGQSGSGSQPAATCAASATQYVWLFVTMDGSRSGAFGATSGGSENVTDITVYYGSSSRPAPDQRLYGGKWFNNESLQPLDTCGS